MKCVRSRHHSDSDNKSLNDSTLRLQGRLSQCASTYVPISTSFSVQQRTAWTVSVSVSLNIQLHLAPPLFGWAHGCLALGVRLGLCGSIDWKAGRSCSAHITARRQSFPVCETTAVPPIFDHERQCSFRQRSTGAGRSLASVTWRSILFCRMANIGQRCFRCAPNCLRRR